ncbi:PASTA domain-containing protein [Parabacteroides sp. Marseille-P3160]|mgnify:CR=1 FL=1|uniref:PASTA domain-containing protein n=1 Tax=Parabacteroides sp. Marseille-P3160 TaxID=1917887 RepID=UPI0009BC66FB|nr:PASTA domain-containing protein [Parabacteroides sp. Marseille-P3160]
MKQNLSKLIKNPFFLNFMLAVLVTLILIVLTLQWLNGYTRHNQSVTVPDVKGLSIGEAAEFFRNNQLDYTIVDSVYTSGVAPGAIAEVVPAIGSKVKQGRIIFVTINATSSKKASIPDVEDLSYRQAQALLQARGFTSIEISYIAGTYKDLAIGVASGGKTLSPGTLVPIGTPLQLLVSDGGGIYTDSLSTSEPTPIDSEEETWF